MAKIDTEGGTDVTDDTNVVAKDGTIFTIAFHKFV